MQPDPYPATTGDQPEMREATSQIKQLANKGSNMIQYNELFFGFENN